MTKDHHRDCLILFVKKPVAGKVKTRLAEKIGPDRARAIYVSFVEDILHMLIKLDINVVIYYSEYETQEAMSAWPIDSFLCRKQTGKDLGERMKNAFEEIFKEGFNRAILIGSDIPDLPAEHISQGFEFLGNHDVVIGPAVDGGYYLIGFKREGFVHDVFNNIAWSTDRVLSETLQVLKSNCITPHFLNMWSDVDTEDDLIKLRQRSAGAEFESSRTISLLNRMFPKGVPR